MNTDSNVVVTREKELGDCGGGWRGPGYGDKDGLTLVGTQCNIQTFYHRNIHLKPT